MPSRVAWKKLAERDLREAYLFLGKESVDAAERFWDAVDAAVRLLSKHPNAGRLRDFRSTRAMGVRSWPVAEFPEYLLFYRIDGELLEIVRLLHGARDLPRLVEGENE